LLWQAAAALVLALNLGMSAANGLRFRRVAALAAAAEPGPAGARPRIADSLDANDPLQPYAARALASLTPAPDAGVLPGNLFLNKEDREWDLP
jgi:hypothetical protein